MRKNPDGWSIKQTHAMHWLPHSSLKSGGRGGQQRCDACPHPVERLGDWARHCRLELFKKLAKSIAERADAVVRGGMIDNRSNAFAEAINGLLQQGKRAARGFRTATNFMPSPACEWPSSNTCQLIHSPPLTPNETGCFVPHETAWSPFKSISKISEGLNKHIPKLVIDPPKTSIARAPTNH